jgi:hypothetical protein
LAIITIHTDMALHRLRWSTRSNLSLTLFGRSVLLLAAEVVTNVIIWIVAALCFAGRKDGVIGSALLAWVSVKDDREWELGG